jgi:hypothetical protein
LKKKYQNAFFIVGLSILGLMITQLDFAEAYLGICRAGYWFLAVVMLWAVLYIFNTAAWWIIIHAPSEYTKTDRQRFSFAWLYKITVSGFALNYATPGGLMGGEPYKIMSLSPKIGTEHATASVILHTMTHIFSHFWFWLLSCVLFILTEPMTMFMGILLALVTLFCLTAIWFFLKGYKKGIAQSLMQVLSHLPFIKRWAVRFISQHADQLKNIDLQIAALHNQNHQTFMMAVLLELICRIISALEIYFILLVIMPEASYIQCILILAFTSLFANMLFFIPLQLGGREGGFLISVNGLGMTASEGIFVALLVRLRELIWTGIGLLLIKLEKKSTFPREKETENV